MRTRLPDAPIAAKTFTYREAMRLISGPKKKARYALNGATIQIRDITRPGGYNGTDTEPTAQESGEGGGGGLGALLGALVELFTGGGGGALLELANNVNIEVNVVVDSEGGSAGSGQGDDGGDSEGDGEGGDGGGGDTSGGDGGGDSRD